MDILVLMPVDEQHAISSIVLMNNMFPEMKNYAFPMAGYADFLVDTGKAKNWEEAVLRALITAENMMQTPQRHRVIIGNVSKTNKKFDLIVDFNQNNELVYDEEKFLTFIKNNYKEEEKNPIVEMLKNLYTKEDSKMTMINYGATGEFLSKYLKTEITIDDKLGERLKANIKFWDFR